MLTDAILTAIDAHHGLALTLGERYAWGEQGAFAVRDATGTPFVLKFDTPASADERLRQARIATNHLHGRGYPVPRYRAHGVVDGVNYSLQELLPGRPIQSVGLKQVPQLVALNELQRGPAPLPACSWPQPILDSVFVGCDGYCVLESLDGYSRVTRALLTQMQALVTDHPVATCRDDDIVHFDFNPANILIHEGQISGVVDWDGVMAGDRIFDLVTLLFYSGEDGHARQALWRYVRSHATQCAITLYMAHIIIRQIDWSIRHHDSATVEAWLGTAAILQTELATT
jgi:hypothetical protein